MIASLALAATWLQSESAADYFPTKPGTSWTYENKGEDAGRTRDIAKGKVKVGELDAEAIETRQGQVVLMSTFYRVANDGVWIVAFDPKMPLDEPYPLFMMPTDKPAEWTFNGRTQYVNDFVPLKMRGKATRIRSKKVFGEEKPCIEVILEASVEAAADVVVRTTQKMVYAKGIGMVSMSSKTLISKNTISRDTQLIEFEAPKQ